MYIYDCGSNKINNQATEAVEVSSIGNNRRMTGALGFQAMANQYSLSNCGISKSNYHCVFYELDMGL